jgi:hypothetical protein
MIFASFGLSKTDMMPREEFIITTTAITTRTTTTAARTGNNNSSNYVQASSIAIDAINIPTSYGPCLNARQPETIVGGFGNTLLLVLNDLAKARTQNETAQEQQQPCVISYGDILARLFVNIESCPDDQPASSCQNFTRNLRMYQLPGHIEQVKASVSDLFQLNSTFIQDTVFRNTPFRTIKDLESVCAVHARFGDAILSRNTSSANTDRRLCKGKNVSYYEGWRIPSCYTRINQRIRQKCQRADVPTSTLYLASDNAAFIRFFLVHPRPNETLLSSSSTAGNSTAPDEQAVQPSSIMHMMDNVTMFDSFTDEGPFKRLVLDWVVIAFSKSRAVMSSSSFSTTASLGFTAVIPPVIGS